MQSCSGRYVAFGGTNSQTGTFRVAKDFFEFVSEDAAFVHRGEYHCLIRTRTQRHMDTAAVEVYPRNLANFVLFFQQGSAADAVIRQLESKGLPTNILFYPAFKTPLVYRSFFDRRFGWAIYDKEQEFCRMSGLRDCGFQSTFVNGNYEVSSTYPDLLYVPKGVDRSILAGSAKFRSKGRLPVLSYYYSRKNVFVVRCAQPLSGITGRSMQDIALLRKYQEMNGAGSKLHIFDARPRINAIANKAKGKGTEDLRDYPFCNYEFLDIPNIHTMRDSLKKYLNTVRSFHQSVSSMWQAINTSLWPKYICLLIEASYKICYKLHNEEISCLVHCSDGWDRTAQLCALSSLILDPFYRSINGFVILVEKDFVSFGHQFCLRNSLVSGKSNEESPIFVQFLESVYQLLQKHPTAFQFNERFLLTIAKHFFSCQFGTFLVDCERERKSYRLPEKTDSLWNYMFSRLEDFLNPFYKHDSDILGRAIFRQHDFKIWRNLYCVHIPDLYDMYTFDSYAYNIQEKTMRNKKFRKNDMPPSNPEWKLITHVKTCQQCSTSILDPTEAINHCWNCGGIFCSLCLINCDVTKYCTTCTKISSITETLQTISFDK